MISIIVSVQRKKDRAKGIAITSAQMYMLCCQSHLWVAHPAVSNQWQNIQTRVIGSQTTKRIAKGNPPVSRIV
jgi:hypothetical protein